MEHVSFYIFKGVIFVLHLKLLKMGYKYQNVLKCGMTILSRIRILSTYKTRYDSFNLDKHSLLGVF